MQITVENLVFRYPGDTGDTLKGISTRIQAGERVAILGHNGSGKTTLVKQLNGLLQPQQGSVWLGEEEVAGKSVTWCAARVALAFQNPDDQICKRRLYDEVAFGPGNLGHRGNRLRHLVDEALALFSLSALAGSNPHDLSYSERKRLAMAAAVAMDTPILVFDEPTAGLDCRETGEFCRVLQALKERGRTVLLITHDMDLIAEWIPRAICLADGSLVYDGRIDTLFSNRLVLDRCGLQPPQIARLSFLLGQLPQALTVDQLIAGVVASRKGDGSVNEPKDGAAPIS